MKLSDALTGREPRTGFVHALALSMIAGVVTGLVWFGVVAVTDRHLSAVSMIVGAGVAHAVVTAGGRGPRYQGLSVGVTLATLLVTEAFAIRLLAVREMVELGVTDALPVLLPLAVMKDLVSAGITADPPTALFWGIALWYAISTPRRREYEAERIGFAA